MNDARSVALHAAEPLEKRVAGRSVLALLCVAVLAMHGLLALDLVLERKRAIAEAVDSALAYAEIKAKDFGVTLTTVDLALEWTEETLVQRGFSEEVLRDSLRRTIATAPLLEDMIVFDRSGRTLAKTAQTALDDGDVTGRLYFRTHFEADSKDFYVGAPLVPDSEGGRVIPITHAMRDDDGRVVGVIGVALPADRFDRVHHEITNANLLVVLARRDGTLVSGTPDTSSLLPELARSAASAFSGTTAADARFAASVNAAVAEYIVAFGPVENTDLVVAVGFSLHEVLAPWRRTAAVTVISAAGLTFLVIGVVGYLLQAFRREARLRREADSARLDAWRRSMQQQTLSSLSGYALEERDPEVFLDRVASALAQSCHADYTFVARRIASGDSMLLLAGTGWPDGVVGGAILAGGIGSHAGYAVQVGEPVIVEDFAQEHRFVFTELLRAAGVRSGVVVPLHAGGAPVGAIGAHYTAPNAVTDGTARFCASVSWITSLYLERKLQDNLRAATFENMPAMIAVVDEKGVIIEVNSGWENSPANAGPGETSWRRGVSYLEALRRSAESGDTGAAALLEGVTDVLAGRSKAFRTELQPGEDSARIYEVIVVPVDLDLRQGALVLQEDVTEERQARERRARSQHMEAIGQLSGGIAHDFNNLLTIIMGNVDLLERHLTKDTRARKLLKSVHDAARRGSTLTDKLLTFGRRQQLEPTAVDPADLLDTLKELLSRTLRAHIDVSYNLHPACGLVKADPAQLQNALLNLVLNAHNALPNGGIINISCGPSDDAAWASAAGREGLQVPPPSKGFVRFTVADNGHGMPPDVLRRVFEPFYTTKEMGKGTGLGLSMVHGFALQSGGQTHIDSVEGEGTIVTIDLPEASSDETAGLPGCEPGDEEIVDLRGLRVCVVEDEPELLKFTQCLLEHEGCFVACARDGEAALSIIDSEPFDLVLSDIIMPGEISGYTLAKHLSRRHPNLPVILMTGYADPKLLEDLFDYNSNLPILRKPFARRALLGALSKVKLSGRALPDPA